MERRLVERSLQDDAFRQRLLSDPKGAIEEELETRLPQEVQVQAVEESAETIYLVLPPAPSRANEQGKSSSPTGSWRAWPEPAPEVTVLFPLTRARCTEKFVEYFAQSRPA
jgi:hypothetical protein